MPDNNRNGSVGAEGNGIAAPTHLALPIPLALRLASYLKDPKFDFDQAVEIIAGLAASPPIRLDPTLMDRPAETV